MQNETITTKTFEAGLKEAVDQAIDSELEVEGTKFRWVRTYEDEGVLTYNCGLVVKMEDGSVFQITIVKSK